MKLKPGNVFIEVCGRKGRYSLCVTDDNGGYRIAGPKVTDQPTVAVFEVNADELIKAIQDHRRVAEEK